MGAYVARVDVVGAKTTTAYVVGVDIIAVTKFGIFDDVAVVIAQAGAKVPAVDAVGVAIVVA